MNIENTMDHRLIYLPQRQGRATRTLYGIATALAWAFYAYLWLPLTTLALWLMGIRSTYFEVYLLDEPLDPPAMLGHLPLIALGCAVLLIGWAEYNRRRFQGKERRLVQADVELDAVAEAMRATPALGIALFDAKRATLRMDHSGAPLDICVGPRLPQVTVPMGTDYAATVAI